MGFEEIDLFATFHLETVLMDCSTPAIIQQINWPFVYTLFVQDITNCFAN